MNNEIIKLCFFGPSGSGKSTIESILKNCLWQKGYWTHIVNMAYPLHNIQDSAYEILELENKAQDGVFLQFLVNHFGIKVLCDLFTKKVKHLENWWITNEYITRKEKDTHLIVNTDCRNNSYLTLKEEGFVFVKVDTEPYLRLSRLKKRQDITSADLSKDVEQTDQIVADYTIDNNGSLEELKKNIENLLDKIKISPKIEKNL